MGHQRTVIVAVIAVAIVKFAVAEVVNMIAVRYSLVALGLVIARAGERRAGRGMSCIDCDGVFVVMIAMAKMQMTVMQVIDMPLVLNGQVSALLAMNMGMFAGMGGMLHGFVLSKQAGDSSLTYHHNSTRKQTELLDSEHPLCAKHPAQRGQPA